MKFDRVCFSYGNKIVLDHFSLVLPDSGITALSAPSGWGKTTLLRLLAGLEVPQSGRISAPPPSAVSILFQENRLLPGLTAENQVKIVLPKGDSAAPWLDAVGLSEAAGLKPEALSGGMQRRVALARCLAYGQHKQLLLLDEPFTGIDLQRRTEIMAFLRSMGLPVLFSAHDPETMTLADRMIQLDKRRLSAP